MPVTSDSCLGVTSFGHDDSDSARATDLSTGQAGEMSRQADMERAA